MVLAGVVELVVVGIAAFLTSILSAIAGLGGGIILLAVLAQFHAPAIAIPIQGAIQFASNGSRCIFLFKDISWDAVWRSCLLLLPASLLGVAVATSIPESAGRAVLAVFALVIAWRPQLLKWRGEDLPMNAMIGVGAASGFINTTVGASGPVTSPFFRAVTASHVAFVATAGAAQVVGHTAKLIAYTLDGWNIGDHLVLILVGIVGVTAGSFVGTRLVGVMSEKRLALLFKVVLSALAIRLLIGAVV